MTTRSSITKEKSPVDKVDYEGLQLDTRARENQDPQVDESKPKGLVDDNSHNRELYYGANQAYEGIPMGIPMGIPSSSGGTLSPMSPMGPKEIDDGLDSAPPREKRICGLRQKHFWELSGLILAIVLAAAIIGGVVGGLQSRHGTSSAINNSTKNTTDSTNHNTGLPLQQGDVAAGSPLNVISYNKGGPDAASQQAFRIYYQSAFGNIKEAVSNGTTSWQSALPIFTDATNNTGLATVTYLNGSEQQGSIFYVGINGYLQEKRKIFSDSNYWEPGTLNNLGIAIVGDPSLPSGNQDPRNAWDSYRMAAVYSENFRAGPGLRVFYHAVNLTGAPYVQELIWTQSNDSWAHGAKLLNPWPTSHLAATIDESTQILRLFFSSGNNTLQEAWMSLSDPTGTYRNGPSFLNLLEYNNADIAAISQNGSTYVYYYIDASTSIPNAQPAIRELLITGIPGSINNQESYNLSSTLVANPDLTTTNNQTAGQQQQDAVSLYPPLAASANFVPGLEGRIYVFWADQVTGDPSTATSGSSAFRQLQELSRELGGSNRTWPAATARIDIPLGDSNSQPHKNKKRRRRWWL